MTDKQVKKVIIEALRILNNEQPSLINGKSIKFLKYKKNEENIKKFSLSQDTLEIMIVPCDKNDVEWIWIYYSNAIPKTEIDESIWKAVKKIMGKSYYYVGFLGKINEGYIAKIH